MDESKLFVVAIDFGTTFSGFAFSSKDQPASIYRCNWKRKDLTSEKTPTSILLDKDKKFVAFGYDAERKYLNDILPMEETDNFYYFRRFKMMLYKERIDINATLKEENGKEMRALDVFTIAIDYLRQQAMFKLKAIFGNTKEDDVQYVITVPSIWDDPAKMFMREAAIRAGIVGSNLMIALESEAASISCQELFTVREEKNFSATIEKRIKYVVVDLGGGTADITVHESRGEGLLEEILPPSGGPWGGNKVDEEYIRFLGLLFGQDVMNEFKEDDPEDYTDLMYLFEVKKRSVTAKQKQSKGEESSDNEIVITMPLSLMNTIKEKRGSIKSVLENSPYKNSVTNFGQKLYFKPDVFRKLFEPTIKLLISHLDVLLKKKELSGLNYIVLVGGFSECDLVQKAVKEKFGKKEKPAIIIPTEAGFAVLKGAVLHGHNPKQISKRILKKTYGIQSWPDFDPDIHPLSKQVRIQGKDRCKDVFYKFAEKGTKVEYGHRKSQIFQVLKPDEKILRLAVYISDDKSPKFVTDPTCQRLGKIVVPLPNLRHGESLDVEESLIFGDTELLFTARDLKTGRTFETQFNFS